MNRFKSSTKTNNSKNDNANSIKNSHKSVNPTPIELPKEKSKGILGALVEGVTIGAGATIGSRIVDSVLGPRTIQIENKQNLPIDNCSEQYKQYYHCIKEGTNNCDNILPDKCKQDKN
jgi:hypothetical protein